MATKIKIDGKIYNSIDEAAKAFQITKAGMYMRLNRLYKDGHTYEYIDEAKQKRAEATKEKLKPKLNPVLIDLGITEPGISIRLNHCLKYERVETVDQLLKLNVCDLLKMPNMGRKSVGRLIDALAKKGLYISTRDTMQKDPNMSLQEYIKQQKQYFGIKN